VRIFVHEKAEANLHQLKCFTAGNFTAITLTNDLWIPHAGKLDHLI